MVTRFYRQHVRLFVAVGVALIILGAVFLGVASAQTPGSPIQWAPPATFDPNVLGLGLPLLPGLQNTIIHDPIPSNAAVSEGGNGIYESTLSGTFNHNPSIALYQDKMFVYWLNHDQDEDSPGQRVLAKVGTFNADQSDINWGGIETLVELAGPPAPVDRRNIDFDPNIITEAASNGTLQIINDRIYLKGRIGAAHGYTDVVSYSGWRGAGDEPVPTANWSDVKTSAFRYDIYHDLGRYMQNWELQGSTLQPASPLYETGAFVDQVEVTPGRFKQVVAPGAPFDNVQPLGQAPLWLQIDVVDGVPESFSRYPNYAPGTWALTEDGTNGLAHYAEFQRPDGTWVALRDNLANPTNFYAAEKTLLSDVYPLGIETNLYGASMPTAGELPDGRPWVIVNSPDRKEMYLALSDDGYVFDKTWLLQSSDRVKIEDGYGKGNGGAQYFQSVTVGGNIWVAYSIGKEQIGVTRVPIASLDTPLPPPPPPPPPAITEWKVANDAWEVASNWTGGIPGAPSNAIIANNAMVNLSSTQTVKQLIIGNDWSYQDGAFGGANTGFGILNVLPGADLTIDGFVMGDHDNDASGDTGTLNQTGGNVTVNGWFEVGSRNAAGFYNISGGTLTSNVALTHIGKGNKQPGTLKVIGSGSTININGTLSVGKFGTLDVEFDSLGISPIVSTADIVLWPTASLNVTLGLGAAFSAGDVFTLIDGATGLSTDSFNGLSDGSIIQVGGLDTFQINYLFAPAYDITLTALRTIPTMTLGDFDGDGDVDGTDFLKWQRGDSPIPSSTSDLANWNLNFGTTTSSLATATTTVPEPSTLVLLATTCLYCFAAPGAQLRRKDRSHRIS